LNARTQTSAPQEGVEKSCCCCCISLSLTLSHSRNCKQRKLFIRANDNEIRSPLRGSKFAQELKVTHKLSVSNSDSVCLSLIHADIRTCAPRTTPTTSHHTSLNARKRAHTTPLHHRIGPTHRHTVDRTVQYTQWLAQAVRKKYTHITNTSQISST